jgi:zinc protease
MKKIFYSLYLLMPFWAAAQTVSTDIAKAPIPGPAPVIKIGQPATFTLPNGLKVFVVQNTKLPRVSATLTIDREAITEGNKAGYVSMAGQLLRRGTLKHKKADLDEIIDFLGAEIETSATSVSANSLSANFAKTFELMADITLRPSFPADELEKIRKQTLSGLAQEKEEPNTISRSVMNQLLYGKKHPYGEKETEKTVNAVTVSDIKKYYASFWKPNIGYLIFVGDITVEQAKKLTTTYFATWKQGIVPVQKAAFPQAPAKTFIAIVDRPASVQSTIRIAAPISLKPGSADAIAASVTASLLGGGSSARLYKNLREKYGFTYGAYASIAEDRLVGSFRATASVRNEKTDSAIGQFLYEFNRLRNELPNEEEVSIIKNESNGAFARSLENPATIAGFALNVARFHLPVSYYQNYLTNLASVNAATVKAIANKYIPANNLVVVIVGNAKEIAKGLDKYGEVRYFDADGNAVAAPSDKKVDASITGETIIANALKASGGSALANIKDVTTSGTASVMGQSLAFGQKYIVPGVFVQTISMQGMTIMKQMAKNGTYSVMQQGSEQPLKDDDKEELEEESNLISEAYFVKKGGYVYTVKGIESIDGKDAYVVAIKSPKGREFTNYYDVASGLKAKMTVSQEAGVNQKMLVHTYYKAYKSYNGVQLPVKMLIDQGQLKIDLSITEVLVNQGLKVEDIK